MGLTWICSNKRCYLHKVVCIQVEITLSSTCFPRSCLRFAEEALERRCCPPCLNLSWTSSLLTTVCCSPLSDHLLQCLSPGLGAGMQREEYWEPACVCVFLFVVYRGVATLWTTLMRLLLSVCLVLEVWPQLTPLSNKQTNKKLNNMQYRKKIIVSHVVASWLSFFAQNLPSRRGLSLISPTFR